MTKNFALTLAILLVSFNLAACWDIVELENRDFINTIAIDKFDKGEKSITFDKKNEEDASRFTVSMALPSLTDLTNAEAEDVKKGAVKTASNETLTTAMRIIDVSSSKKMYFGHAKVVIFGEELLKDEKLFRETMDALERNQEISRKITVLATKGDAAEIVNGEVKGELLLGMFVSNFYKNSTDAVAMAFEMNLEHLINKLRSTNCAIIPQIEIENEQYKLSGAAVLKNFKLVGWLDDEETRGYLWLQNKADGAQITTKYENGFVPLRVESAKTTIEFSEENDKIVCNVNTKVKGIVEEYTFGQKTLEGNETIEILQNQFAEIVQKEIKHTSDTFQKEYGADGFSLVEKLRKNNYDIYTRHLENSDAEKMFEEMEIVAQVKIEIESTGAIK